MPDESLAPEDRSPDPDPLSDEVRSGVLEDEEGEPYVIDQQNQSEEVAEGAGEWPSPSESPPQAPAPGSADG